jgi:eukaryotic translation initiation factor 2C
VLQQHASRTGFRVGKNRYFHTPTDRERFNLGQGVNAWKGFFLSVRPTFGQLMVSRSCGVRSAIIERV